MKVADMTPEQRERKRANAAAYYLRNRDAIRAKEAARYANDPNYAERAKRRTREWIRDNREQYLASHAEYRNARRAELTAKQTARYWADHERHLAKQADYRKRARERNRAKARQESAKITDSYARNQLAKYSPLSTQEFPQELVEAKRLEILLKRLTKPNAHLKQTA